LRPEGNRLAEGCRNYSVTAWLVAERRNGNFL
jgi:hypothetical protein